MLFRQLFDRISSTYTYLVADPATGDAALIDPVLENVDRDLGLVRELGLRLRYVLDTHVHADHVTGAGEIRARTGAASVSGCRGASCASLRLDDGARLEVGGLTIEVLATPGHTDDSVSYRIGGNVFTGDAMLIRGNGRTDFQNGDAATLYDSLTKVLFALPDDTRVWPGHDYRGFSSSTIGEEKRWNPRIAGATREQFVATMAALDLPPPQKLDMAVAANRACGRVALEDMHAVPPPPGRADEIDAAALPALAARIIDVREPDEASALPLPGAELVPLGGLEAAARTWDRDAELVLVCRSGRRSLDAARQLAALGFTHVHSLRGGIQALKSQPGSDFTTR